MKSKKRNRRYYEKKKRRYLMGEWRKGLSKNVKRFYNDYFRKKVEAS